jgi:hypothetical protein
VWAWGVLSASGALWARVYVFSVEVARDGAGGWFAGGRGGECCQTGVECFVGVGGEGRVYVFSVELSSRRDEGDGAREEEAGACQAGVRCFASVDGQGRV